MKKLIFNLSLTLLVSCVILSVACDNEKLSDEAKIILSFQVYREDGSTRIYFNAEIGEDRTVTIKVSPFLDATKELEEVYPVFYLSKGATVTPDPSLPQNFATPGGVKYIVTSENGKNKNEYTVTWGITDPLPYGEGFANAEVGVSKTFVELGYPGQVANWDIPSIEYGDLLMYHAYCGDYIVLLSRIYIDTQPSSPHCIKVVNKTTLENAGISLNLGSISLANLKMISSDYKGRCVGVVTTGGETEIFYWTTPTEAPKSIGKYAQIDMATTTDGSANFQVAGDITGNAWITALAPRGQRGDHYRIKVTNGRLENYHAVISTGYSSSDCSGFQMISPFDDSDNPAFVIGDSEGTVGSANTNKCYVRSPAGTTTYVMPGFWNNTLPIGHPAGTWYVGTGMATTRTGGRSPAVSAMLINGKTYVTVAGGSGYYHAAAVLTSDLQKLAHNKLDVAPAQPISRGWCYGAWIDWYWDDDKKEAYLAIWFGRYGLLTYKLSAFE